MLRRILLLISFFLTVAFIGRCSVKNIGTLTIVNDSGEPLSNVSVRVSKSLFNTGVMQQGQTKSFAFDILQDSASYDLDLNFLSGRHFRITNIGSIVGYEESDRAVVMPGAVEIIFVTHFPLEQFWRKKRDAHKLVYSLMNARCKQNAP